jgi:hypothetical protein
MTSALLALSLLSQLTLLSSPLLLSPSTSPMRHDLLQDDCKAVAGTHISLHEDDDKRRMLIVERNQCLDVRSQGRVSFTADDADLATLSPGGYLYVTETRSGTTRRMSFTERDGRIMRQYTVNGDTRPSAESEEWLRTVLPRVARESTIGAEARVARILRERGPAGAIGELENIHSESIKSLYVDALLSDSRTGPTELRDLARRLPELMSSDSRRATMMTTLLRRSNGDPAIVDALLESSRSISSDHQRGIVLNALLERDNLSRPTLLAALRSIGGISSDREKASALIALASHREAMTDDNMRRAFLETTRSISSSSEYRRVMEAVVR